MIERLTPPARRIVALADREAKTLESPVVGDEHLALAFVVELPFLLTPGLGHEGFYLPAAMPKPDEARALLRRDAHDALATLGISLDEVERRVEETFGPEAWTHRSDGQRLNFSRDARHALTLALRRSLELRRSRVSDSDVLAGVVQTGGRGRRLLAEIGIDVDDLERRIESDNLFAPGPGFR
jgi:hypothetical protein